MARTLGILAAIIVMAVAIAGCSPTDAAITAQVKNRLTTDDTTKVSRIDVTTTGKVVTLAGNVDSAAVKSKAVDLARTTNGVTDVVDKLVVPAQSTQPAVGAATSTGPPSPVAGVAFGPAMMDMHRGEMGMPPAGMMREMGRSASAVPSTAVPSEPPAAPLRPLSAMPGMPGVSHLHHIGSTGFFLDQPQVGLTSEQQSRLRQIMERALTERGNADRAIEAAEEELSVLTGAGTDEARVEVKIAEIERARTNQRIEFIRAVSNAIETLTPEQRALLLGSSNKSSLPSSRSSGSRSPGTGRPDGTTLILG
jgi:Spy/CpxP family protein refolding chaperone